jgi:hypothetical protein
VLTINPSQVHGDRFAGWVQVPPGMAPIQTNIAGGDYVVHLTGLRWVGRSAQGFAVVERRKDGSGRVHVVITAAHTAAAVVGWILSVVAILVLLAVLVYAFIQARLASREGPAPPVAAA